MAWTKIAYQKAQSGDGVTVGPTTAIDTTASGGADLIVAGVTCYTGDNFLTNHLTDSAGNTWSIANPVTLGSLENIGLYYCLSPSTSATHTFTFHDGISQTYPSIEVLAMKGQTGYDTYNEQAAPATGVSALSASAIGQTNGLVVAVLTIEPGYSGLGIGSSFTLEAANAGAGGAAVGGALAWKTVAGTENPTWNWTTSEAHICALISFTGTGGGGGAVVNPFRCLQG